ncbi:MAG: sulfoxide reductase heme-binding subunit YedZ [Anaerolineales bacterium]|nr:sulfoxide reductase heme-binding subunit YedZ [Anaerolineae bacterium]PWB75995.1 MAG: sulfoxide reductase heme-binding subunit YedZ [Anaerolineales bacterium]
MKTIFKRYTPLQIAMHVYAWSVLVILIFQYFTGDLTADPVQYLERRTGHHAVALLILSLACTPLNTLFKWSELLKRRRALGLYAFMYATIHVLIYLHLDFGLAWSFILQNFTQDPRLIVGLIAFLLLIPLAWTSFDIWKKRLGKNWKRLHKAVYLIVPLVVLHFAWNKKGNIFTAQGDIAQPLIYGLIVIIFLVMRIPQVRRGIVSVRDRIRGQYRKQRAVHQVSS